MESIGQILQSNANDAVAVEDGCVDGTRHVTYAELLELARRAAGALRAHGVTPGDRVLLQTRTCVQGVVAWLGVIFAGATVVPVARGAAPAEVESFARATRARLALGVRAKGVTTLALDPLRGEPFEEAPDEVAMILFTSGTTGSAKGAEITHASLVAHTRSLVENVLRLGRDDVVLGVLPVGHSYGIRMTVLAPLFAGARVVLAEFDAATSMRLAVEHGVTWLPGVPTMFHAWAETPGEPPPALRWALSAGASLADDVRTRAEARLGVSVREGYGLTEATFCCIDAPPDPRKPGCVGRPVPGVDVRVAGGVDSDRGEILVRGANLMRGYLDDPDATASVMDAGWLRTGDLGRLDADGRLYVVDRLKDLIVRGGHNVVPAEVENVLMQHPSVAEAAVVGRTDARYGEEIVAVLVLRDPAQFEPTELDRFCRAQLARSKVPREWVAIERMPLGPSRKVLRRELRAQLESGTLVPVRFQD